MPVTNPSVINMAIPDYLIDNIIGIHAGSFTVSAPTLINDPTTATDTFNTGFGDTCLFQGVFSTDGGTSWNDFGTQRPTGIQLQTVTCQGYMSGGTFTAVGKNYYDSVHSSGSSYTIQYKVAFLAKDNQGAITPIPTKEIIQYNSTSNFQKIFKKGTFTSGGATIAHNLGYIPKVRGWFSPSSATYGFDGAYQLPSGCLTTLDWFASGVVGGIFLAEAILTIDTSNAYFTAIYDNNSSIVSGTTYYRVYLDS